MEEKTWIACALDSEGSITEQICDEKKPCRGCPHIQIEISNANREYINKIVAIVPDGTIRIKPNPPFGTKPLHVWRLMKQRSVLSLLREIEPHLIIRREKAKEILNRYSQRPVPLHPRIP